MRFSRRSTDKGYPPCEQTKGKRDLEMELFHIGLVFVAAGIGIGALCFFLFQGRMPQLPCIMSTVMGLYCPGCGGTRAAAALLRGQIFLSIWYHPLIPYSAVIMGGFMVTQGLHRLGVKRIKGWKFHNWYLYVAVIILVVNFLIKNMLRLVWGIIM